ncbi:transcriptional regulator [Paraburkholderia sp.]|uniref:anti-sigma factor family protein n=1 Tax=Paraburkholderia sp. TaxID=1926495 RepID=UPI0023974214|nr:transcriptional regulator [Paraburkholderia sp.]MDE1182545.1 transcriptional regulator [Paraburkholderia sp.]
MPNDPSTPDLPSETDLNAYADGLLAAPRTARVQRYLRSRAGEARRVAFYGQLNARMRDAFPAADEPDADPGPADAAGRGSGGSFALPACRPACAAADIAGMRRRNGSPRAWRGAVRPLLTLAIALVVVLIAASGWIAASQVSAEALNNAAVTVLTQLTGEHEPTNGTTTGATAAGLPVASAVQAAPLPALSPEQAAAAPDLSSVNMRLVSQRTLKLGTVSRATEYVYLNRDSQPIVLLTAFSLTTTAQPQWMARRVGDLRLLIWTTHGRRYVLAGAARAHDLMRAADAMTMK